MAFGELAVNYASADPTIFLKDSAGNIIQIAGANAISTIPTLDQITTAGNFSSDGILIGGSLETSNILLNSDGSASFNSYVKSEACHIGDRGGDGNEKLLTCDDQFFHPLPPSE